MISNPCSYYVNSNQSGKFKYEGGTTLFHFCPTDNGFHPHWIPMNLIFFANDEKHGLDVVRRMLEFGIECKAKYIRHKANEKSRHWEDFKEKAEKEMEHYKKYLDALHEGKIKLSLAPTNQFFKVGWADNDNV